MHCPVCGAENLRFVEDFSSNFITISDAVVRYPIKYIECLACEEQFQTPDMARDGDVSYSDALHQDVE